MRWSAWVLAAAGVVNVGCGSLEVRDAWTAVPAPPPAGGSWSQADTGTPAEPLAEHEAWGGELLAQAEPAPAPPAPDAAPPDEQPRRERRVGGPAPATPPATGASRGLKPADTAVQPGRSSPLLIYTASFTLAVFEVAPTQRALLALTQELGGFLAARSDEALTLRVPASRFHDAVARLEELGDVLHRDVRALDVTEEFRDLTVRLRNAEVVRARLEELLQKAATVEEALEVQRELATVTGTIEALKGRLRFFEDRLAYSTLSIRFRPRPRATPDAPASVQLPFAWLDQLGLPTLLDLR